MLRTMIRRSTTAALAVAGAAAFAVLPMGTAQAAPQQAKAPAAACSQDQAHAKKGLICYLDYCDANYCYYNCYPTAAAKQAGKSPANTKKVPKPSGKPSATISG